MLYSELGGGGYTVSWGGLYSDLKGRMLYSELGGRRLYSDLKGRRLYSELEERRLYSKLGGGGYTVS